MKEKKNKEIQSIAPISKDTDFEASEVDKIFFVFLFNCIGQEIEDILSKHIFFWWDRVFFERSKKVLITY